MINFKCNGGCYFCEAVEDNFRRKINKILCGLMEDYKDKIATWKDLNKMAEIVDKVFASVSFIHYKNFFNNY